MREKDTTNIGIQHPSCQQVVMIVSTVVARTLQGMMRTKSDILVLE